MGRATVAQAAREARGARARRWALRWGPRCPARRPGAAPRARRRPAHRRRRCHPPRHRTQIPRRLPDLLLLLHLPLRDRVDKPYKNIVNMNECLKIEETKVSLGCKTQ